MNKAIHYGLVVLALWAWLEIQTQGTQGAFGGAIAWMFTPVATERPEPRLPRSPITEQVRDRVNGHMAHAEARRNRLAGPER
ncbi:MAG: hypothetical protein JRH10_16620 [Deltaproteobacteria bacterium]|nr:hypothetical protein [Deltaproteobacteria bacterium]